jgi:cytochrome c5
MPCDPLEFFVFKRWLPLLIVLPGFAAEPAKAPRNGETVYRVYCGSCHGGGWQGAPVAYDKAEWESRMANGFAAMLANAKKGINTMPPMGACMDCSDDELADAIKEMLRF